MTFKSDAKFKEKLTCGFKYYMTNSVNFHPCGFKYEELGELSLEIPKV